MGDTPLAIAAATVQFLGICSLINDLFSVCHFVSSSREYNSDLKWLSGALKWELQSLDQWGVYAGLKRSSEEPEPQYSLLASPSVRKRVADVLDQCRNTIEELKDLLRTDGGLAQTDDLQYLHIEAQ